jgi:hypothetical protein
MLRSGNHLKGFRLGAEDGAVGSVKEFYFEDDSWTVRYIVADTGPWLLNRPVLVSPASVRRIDDAGRTISVALTKEQVKRSPPLETDKPVSRRYEELLNSYFRIAPYWKGRGRWGGGAFPSVLAAPEMAVSGPVQPEPGDPHLRSSREITHYVVQAKDGDAGAVDDFILDDRTWAIRYVVVDTREWWPGGTVLISPLWVTKISWDQSRIFADLPRRVIREAPGYDPSQPITDDYERRLFRYYGCEEYLNLLHLKQPSKA